MDRTVDTKYFFMMVEMIMHRNRAREKVVIKHEETLKQCRVRMPRQYGTSIGRNGCLTSLIGYDLYEIKINNTRRGNSYYIYILKLKVNTGVSPKNRI